MRDDEIHIGDVLQIRQWEDMKEEFGLEREGGILLVPSFSRKMRYLCGTQFTVKNIYKDICGICYRSFEGGENERPFGHWYISADMLEPFAEDDFEVANDEDMKLLFC